VSDEDPWYAAFDYDFNNPNGRVVISRALFEEGEYIGRKVMLVSIEGNRREGDDYDGFGTIVTVTGVQDPIASPDHVALITDYPNRWRRKTVGECGAVNPETGRICVRPDRHGNDEHRVADGRWFSLEDDD
jgi:hypothetical protein